MSLKKGNVIRTILLLKISNELNTNKLKKSKLKINSKSSFEIGKKYSNTIINIDNPTETTTNQIDYHFSNNLNNFKNNICSSPNSKISDITLDYLKKENNRIDSAYKHSRRKRFISKNYDENNIIINKDNNINNNNINNNKNIIFINLLKKEKNKLELLSIKYLRKLAKLFKNVSLFEKIKKINELNKENINFNSENKSENIIEKNNENSDSNNQKGKNLKLYFITDSNTNESIIHLKKMKHSKKKLKSNDNLVLYKSLSHEPDILKKHRKRNSLFSKKSYKNILTQNNISTETKHSLFLIEKTNHYFHEDNLDNIINNEHNNIKKGKKQNNNSNRNKSMMKMSKNLNIL
jgi:hypothetical protein